MSLWCLIYPSTSAVPKGTMVSLAMAYLHAVRRSTRTRAQLTRRPPLFGWPPSRPAHLEQVTTNIVPRRGVGLDRNGQALAPKSLLPLGRSVSHQCPLLTQSGHSVLRIVAAQNDARTPFRGSQIPAVIGQRGV